MAEFAPRARENLDKSTHPDLQRAEDGSLQFRADAGLPPPQRDFYRMWQDEAQRSAFMGRLARQQAQLPEDVQRAVAGQQFDGYDSTPDPYAGYLQYRSTIADLRRGTGEVTSADIAAMDLATYDALFDENGQPRQGVIFSPTGRDVDVTDRGSGIDPYSQRELGGNR